MRRAFKAKAPLPPPTWRELPAGEMLWQLEQACFNQLSQRLFGYHLLKVGQLSADISLSQCAIRHHVGIGERQQPNVDVIGAATQLPFAEQSIDAVIMAHTLDYAQDPHAVLRDIDRVVTHSGYVLLSGFNPFSITALGKLLPTEKNQYLSEARFFSAHRVKDWLQLLSYDIVAEQRLVFSMLSCHRFWQRHPQWQNTLQRLCPWANAVYMILARKRIYPLTPIRQRKRAPALLHPHAGLSPVVGFQDVQLGPARSRRKYHPL